jgi:hypothetical protein
MVRKLRRVRMRQVVLPQQILSVIVAVGCSHYAVDVLLGWLLGVVGKLREICGTLVIEFDEDDRALDAVVKGAIRLRAADPGEPGVIEMKIHFIHLHARVSLVHVAYVQVDQVAEILPRSRAANVLAGRDDAGGDGDDCVDECRPRGEVTEG